MLYRLLGVVTAFLYAVLDGRALSVRWEHPLAFSLAFDSPNAIDWSFPYTSTTQPLHPLYGDPEMIANVSEVIVLNWEGSQLDAFIPKIGKWLDKSKSWVRVSGYTCLAETINC